MSHLHALISPRLWEFRERGETHQSCAAVKIFNHPFHANETSRTFCRHGSHRKNIHQDLLLMRLCVPGYMALGVSFLPFLWSWNLTIMIRYHAAVILPQCPKFCHRSSLITHHSSLITPPDPVEDIAYSLAAMTTLGDFISRRTTHYLIRPFASLKPLKDFLNFLFTSRSLDRE